MECGLVF
jgi:hypothetical protein